MPSAQEVTPIMILPSLGKMHVDPLSRAWVFPTPQVAFNFEEMNEEGRNSWSRQPDGHPRLPSRPALVSFTGLRNQVSPSTPPPTARRDGTTLAKDRQGLQVSHPREDVNERWRGTGCCDSPVLSNLPHTHGLEKGPKFVPEWYWPNYTVTLCPCMDM